MKSYPALPDQAVAAAGSGAEYDSDQQGVEESDSAARISIVPTAVQAVTTRMLGPLAD
jgi:hypothetical protein